MNRYHPIILAAVVVLAVMVAAPVALADGGDDDDDGVTPGERLMGSVGAQEAELGAEVDERAFGQAIATAAADGDTEALADLLAERAERLEANHTELAERLADLQERHEAGELTTGEFRQEIAKLEVERQSLVRQSGMTADAAMGLPTEVLEDRGINVTAIETLQANASELGGEEVREIARSIAGPHVGNASPERPSPSERMVAQIERIDDPAVAIDRAAHWIDQANRTVDRTGERAERFDDPDRGPVDSVDEAVWESLADANASLETARASLADAEDALAAGDEDAALEHAADAAAAAAEAMQHANAAAAGLRGIPGGGPGLPIGPP